MQSIFKVKVKSSKFKKAWKVRPMKVVTPFYIMDEDSYILF